ncbi:MAG TPA: NADH-ubiquinone oxidoreductase-F iron-sulfur binding region domain-containing protein [Actinomycetota bacterium]|nr:NADH-ubiquinone oxidoreductase-F iron-sulfur binding region domain-containing protein [Actinomycetota bacterium]
MSGPSGLLDAAPASLEEYAAVGGGRGLERALGMDRGDVILEVTRSGLRGRGGGGFPTGQKWAAIAGAGAGERFAVANGAEGEPATFKDRALLRRNPYQVLEGLAIAAHAVGARRAFIGLKGVFHHEIARLRAAVEEMEAADALGGVEVGVVLGPDHYLLGEETGLLEVIEGRDPLPRILRPFAQGLFGTAAGENPTLVNNVETLANVPHILREGPGWLARAGTEGSPGTMVFTVCGDVAREGVVELPLGTPLRGLVEGFGGGVREGRLKAIVPGASNTVLLPEELDVPLDFDSMRRMGSGLGSGGFAVFGDGACVVQLAFRYSRFLWVESCAQCPPCKLGTDAVTQELAGIEAGRGDEGSLARILARARTCTDGQRCALPTGESLLIQSLVHAFGEEFREHLGRPCPRPGSVRFPKLEDLDEGAGRFRYDEDHARKQPDWTYGGP